jgi:hypothetical protein
MTVGGGGRPEKLLRECGNDYRGMYRRKNNVGGQLKCGLLVVLEPVQKKLPNVGVKLELGAAFARVSPLHTPSPKSGKDIPCTSATHVFHGDGYLKAWNIGQFATNSTG